jgi:hypothetical protein
LSHRLKHNSTLSNTSVATALGSKALTSLISRPMLPKVVQSTRPLSLLDMDHAIPTQEHTMAG